MDNATPAATPAGSNAQPAEEPSCLPKHDAIPTAGPCEDVTPITAASDASAASALAETADAQSAGDDGVPHAFPEHAGAPAEAAAATIEASANIAESADDPELSCAPAAAASGAAALAIIAPPQRRPPPGAARAQGKPMTPPPENRARRFVNAVEKNGYMAASLIVALGLGWVVGANTFDGAEQSRRLVDALQAHDAKFATAVAAVEQLRVGLDATRNNAAAAVAQLTTKFDRLDRDQNARHERMAERLDRVEKTVGSMSPTASISQIPAPAPPQPVVLASPEPAARADASRVPQTPPDARAASRIPPNGYVLREVVNGAALLESRTGLREVVPGDALPGLGRVRSIERRGKQWVVVTTGGVIDSQSY